MVCLPGLTDENMWATGRCKQPLPTLVILSHDEHLQDGKQHGIGVFKTAKGDFRRGEWKARRLLPFA